MDLKSVDFKNASLDVWAKNEWALMDAKERSELCAKLCKETFRAAFKDIPYYVQRSVVYDEKKFDGMNSMEDIILSFPLALNTDLRDNHSVKELVPKNSKGGMFYCTSGTTTGYPWSHFMTIDQHLVEAYSQARMFKKQVLIKILYC